jgi:quercetin dioxygenase-like cupin family protein
MNVCLRRLFVSALMFAIPSTAAVAQGAQANKPDPSRIPFTLPKHIDWKETGSGEYQAKLFGDPSKAGIYGVLIKWMPGHFSHPHSHSQQRYIYVVSGTWWVSDSSTYGPSKTYPLPAGTFAMDNVNAIHWDGAKPETGPAILELVGMGPVVTTHVGADK